MFALVALFALFLFFAECKAPDDAAAQCQRNWKGMKRAVELSLQSWLTVGYGHIRPETLEGHAIIVLQNLVVVSINAFVMGAIYFKFTKPRCKLLFSPEALVTRHNGRPALVVRCSMSQPHQHLLEPSFRMDASVLLKGQWLRVYNLALEEESTSTLTLSTSTMLVHPLLTTDEAAGAGGGSARSPLLDAWADGRAATLHVTVDGIDAVLQEAISVRVIYEPEHILFSRRFRNMISVGPRKANEAQNCCVRLCCALTDAAVDEVETAGGTGQMALLVEAAGVGAHQELLPPLGDPTLVRAAEQHAFWASEDAAAAAVWSRGAAAGGGSSKFSSRESISLGDMELQQVQVGAAAQQAQHAQFSHRKSSRAEEKAVVKLQAIARGRLGRRLAAEGSAARRLQRVWRRKSQKIREMRQLSRSTRVSNFSGRSHAKARQLPVEIRGSTAAIDCLTHPSTWCTTLLRCSFTGVLLLTAVVIVLWCCVFALLIMADSCALQNTAAPPLPLNTTKAQECAVAPKGFQQAFFFAYQTQSTIGYGVLVPDSAYADWLVGAFGLAGCVVTMLLTGLLWAKFSMTLPTARFSAHACVAAMGDGSGRSKLVLRVAGLYSFSHRPITMGRLDISLISFRDKATTNLLSPCTAAPAGRRDEERKETKCLMAEGGSSGTLSTDSTADAATETRVANATSVKFAAVACENMPPRKVPSESLAKRRTQRISALSMRRRPKQRQRDSGMKEHLYQLQRRLTDSLLCHQYVPLRLRNGGAHPLCAFPASFVHVIDESSPLYGKDAATFEAGQCRLECLFRGWDSAFGKEVHVVHTYLSKDVCWESKFADTIRVRRRKKHSAAPSRANKGPRGPSLSAHASAASSSSASPRSPRRTSRTRKKALIDRRDRGLCFEVDVSVLDEVVPVNAHVANAAMLLSHRTE